MNGQVNVGAARYLTKGARKDLYTTLLRLRRMEKLRLVIRRGKDDIVDMVVGLARAL